MPVENTLKDLGLTIHQSNLNSLVTPADLKHFLKKLYEMFW